jgi:hypothetical protein
MKTLLTVVLGVTSVVSLYGQGHSHEHGKTATTTRITGTVVDIACFVGHESTGAKHAKCAEVCARAGNPLAIYDATGKSLYLPVSMDHTNPNTKLLPFIEQNVTVTGKVMEKGGLKGIAIDSVERAK